MILQRTTSVLHGASVSKRILARDFSWENKLDLNGNEPADEAKFYTDECFRMSDSFRHRGNPEMAYWIILSF